jgi:hypothetical protein
MAGFDPILPVFSFAAFSFAANSYCRTIARNVQQPLGFGTGFVAASIRVVWVRSKNERLWHLHFFN